VFKMPWYDRLNRYLLPGQDLVKLALLLIGGLCIYFAAKSDPAKRTGFLVYLISP
jgi:hypothetical protein